MKKLKKKSILCCALAIAFSVLLAGSTVLGVNADDTVGDVNGDGNVTIQDATFLNQFLSGIFTVSNLTKLDVDGNGVISAADSAEVLSIYANAGAGNN